MLLVGAGIGIYLTFFFSYQVHPDAEVHSFLFPLAFLVLERYDDGTERWVDFVTPMPMLVASSNIATVASTMTLPVWLANTLWRIGRTQKTTEAAEGS